MNKSQWIEWRLCAPREDAEICAQWLLDAGCSGTQIDDVQLLLDESEDATFTPREDAVVSGYFEARDAAQIERAESEIRSALERSDFPTTLERTVLDDTDWSTNWRENFPPLAIGRFLIVPSWEDVKTPKSQSGQNEALEIRLDPGLAFGTGQHPTTHLCLELLGEYLPQSTCSEDNASASTFTPPRLLDVGCGSGILSIAAAKLGAKVVASDLDVWCVRASRDNAAENNVSFDVVQAAGLEWTNDKFDFVIANLMSALLISLSPQLARVCGPASTLIVSGISSPRADDVEAALHAVGFQTVQKRERDGDTRGDYTERWTAFVMKRA